MSGKLEKMALMSSAGTIAEARVTEFSNGSLKTYQANT